VEDPSVLQGSGEFPELGHGLGPDATLVQVQILRADVDRF
jgi:hypothetical protein